MAYPATLDTTTTIPVESASTPLSTNHVVNHTAMQTAIIAIETLIGVTASAITGTINYILGEITGSDKAVGKTAIQTLTNKTFTSPVINVGSDADGDIYYRLSGILTRLAKGSNGTILKLAAGVPSWAAETVTVNASTTVAGIVEEATQAEVDAQTATGGTGARLFVNPSTLSTGLLGSNFTATESITAGQPVSGYFYQSDGGVLFDAKTTNNSSVGSAGAVTSFAFSVASNTNRALVLFVNIGSSGGTISAPSVTYNGVSMTLQNTQALGASTKTYAFTLLAPSTGSNSIAITVPAGGVTTQYVSAAVHSYYNVTSIESTTGAVSNTVSYGTPGLGTLLCSGAGGNTVTSLTNTNTNYQTSGTNTFAVITSADSAQAFTTASATVAFSNAGSQSIQVVGLVPVTAPSYSAVCKSSAATPSNGVNLNKYATFLGFAQSSVSAGQTTKVTTDGLVTGLTSLTSLATYYLADTAGNIGISAGTNSKKIGFAQSSTTLILKDTI